MVFFFANAPAIQRPLKNAPTWATLVQNSRLPARVINASVLEHDVPPVDNELQELVMGYRPPLSEAVRLCEIYLEWGETLSVIRMFPLIGRVDTSARWIPLSRHELLDEIVGSVYRTKWVGRFRDVSETYSSPQFVRINTRPSCLISSLQHFCSCVTVRFQSPRFQHRSL